MKCLKCKSKTKLADDAAHQQGLSNKDYVFQLAKLRGFQIYLCQCGIRYSCDKEQVNLVNKKLTFGELNWFFNSKTCALTDTSTEQYKNTILPWLPYDVTEEKLQLFLTLS